MTATAHTRGSRCRRPVARWRITLSLAAWLLVWPGASRAQELRSSELEAAFLLNFLRFASWPEPSFEFRESPVVVTVIGADAIAADLSVLSSEERLGPEQRSVEVRVRDGVDPTSERAGRRHGRVTAADLRRSHLIFVGRDDESSAEWILAQVRGTPVLTVGDVPAFARKGGMLELVVRGGRMTFDANAREIDRSGVSMSSKVLRLARLVETGDE